ncbi:MAG: hypothetical protein ABIW80_01095, partial [Lapillicoccus sp.]
AGRRAATGSYRLFVESARHGPYELLQQDVVGDRQLDTAAGHGARGGSSRPTLTPPLHSR